MKDEKSDSFILHLSSFRLEFGRCPMPKTIYTERDIEDLARRGVKAIPLTDDVYITDVARERAEKLGVALRAASASVPAAASPSAAPSVPRENVEQVVSQVKADVLAKLGSSVDAALIERIVRRVVSQLGVGG
jgi:hypothetical protein